MSQLQRTLCSNLCCQTQMNCLLSPQLHNRLGKGQERHIENNQEETEAQGPRHCEDRHQDGSQRLLLQLFHSARG